MFLIHFPVSSHCDCTLGRGIFLGDIMKLRTFVAELADGITPTSSDKQYQACLIFWVVRPGLSPEKEALILNICWPQTFIANSEHLQCNTKGND